MKVFVLLLALVLSGHAEGRVIGSVNGNPVLESQLSGTTESERGESLRTLFVRPALQAYLEPHRDQWQLTEPEIQQLIAAYRDSLRCTPQPPAPVLPDFERRFAQFIGANIKVQRFIYEQNGGGRILFQQAGPEAFDATRRLLLRLEEEGKISFNDQEHRNLTFKYWFNEDQPGLLDDPGPDKAFKLDQALVECPRN